MAAKQVSELMTMYQPGVLQKFTQEEDEMAEHIQYACDGLDMLRFQLLGAKPGTD